MKFSPIVILSLIFIFSCKTQEEISRNQLVEDISLQMNDSRKLSADSQARLQAIEERVALMDGKLEETGHRTEETLGQKITVLEERLLVLETSDKTTQETVAKMQIKMDEQSAYIQTVLKALKGLKGSKKKTSKKRSPFSEAMSLYKKGKYSLAKEKLLPLISNKKIKGDKKARIYHNLGLIEFMDKKNEDAIIYFSKIFGEFPKSKYNKNGLLFMGKTFKRMNKNDEAKQSFKELLKKYPKSKQAKEAANLLKKL